MTLGRAVLLMCLQPTILFSVLMLVARATVPSITEGVVLAALHGDDQCTNESHVPVSTGCSLNTIQVKREKLSTNKGKHYEDKRRADAPTDLQDLTAKQRQNIRANITAAQSAIMQSWTELRALSADVNKTSNEVKAVLTQHSQNVDSALLDFTCASESAAKRDARVVNAEGRRRVALPARQAKTLKELAYLQSELDVLWRTASNVSRANNEIQNLIGSHHLATSHGQRLLIEEAASMHHTNNNDTDPTEFYKIQETFAGVVEQINGVNDQIARIKADFSKTQATAVAYLA
ncbi:unnamed protein product [Polarella glacialis]|uniref:Uncharacterized protein n=1 Tax=Polarella glacialis TaxID=89957 RepID=A0A813IPV9_POLGL|nr:unnamed protein product [Polarella glacialis]